MDESWRRRQPHHVSNYQLGPDDFRDVFGGPPRSVLLRHFSPSSEHADSRFRIRTRGSNSHDRTGFCKPDSEPVKRSGRNGFHVTKREFETANNNASCQPDLAISTCSRDKGPQVMKSEESPPYDKVVHRSNNVSATCFTHSRFPVIRREEHFSFLSAFRKRDGPSTASDKRNRFQVMEKENESSHETKSGFNATDHANNVLRFVNSEDDDMFSNDASIYRPIVLVPRREEGFYNDVFGSDCGGSDAGLRRPRSRSFSKSESESTAFGCCEDAVAPTTGYGDGCDRMLASFASKLRPITIPAKRYDSSPPSTISEEEILCHVGPSSPSTYFKENPSSSSSNNPSTVNKSRCTASS